MIENMIENLTVGEPFGTSDHQIVRWLFVACRDQIKQEGEHKQFDYFRASYDEMRGDAQLINWADVVKGQDVEKDWFQLNLALRQLKDK